MGRFRFHADEQGAQFNNLHHRITHADIDHHVHNPNRLFAPALFRAFAPAYSLFLRSAIQ